MSGVPIVTVELSVPAVTKGDPPDIFRVATAGYTTAAGDTPASTWFEPRITSTLRFSRSVGCTFWGEDPRGRQGFGVIRLANGDGRFDSLVGRSLRDGTATIKRGMSGAAFSTFVTVATLLIDRAEFEDERAFVLYLKDASARLERALQLSLYSTAVTNQALRGRPRPITIGTCYQVPLQQPDVFGNGRFDVHDSDDWLGVNQVLDQGASMIEGTAYRRAITSGIYGIERLTAIGGQQAASVAGAFRVLATPINDSFASLAGWTEANGGAAGRDASLDSGALRLLNTAGGVDLTMTSVAAIDATAADVFVYDFDVVSWTSGQAELRIGTGATVASRIINAAGRYTGAVRAAAAFNVVLRAADGSNCDLRIDNFRLRRVALIERLPDVLSYLCVTKGPLTTGDLDTTAINALDAAAPRRIGYHASEPVQIADVLDEVLASFGGWWYINRLGKLTVGRLAAPSGSPAYTFDTSSIVAGMSIEFDAAPGLSRVILAQRNWSQFTEGSIVASLNSVALSTTDKDADVTLSGNDYSYATAGVGSVRSVPGIFGDRYYFEVRINTRSADFEHFVGFGSASAAIGSFPGSDAHAVAFRAGGELHRGAGGESYGFGWGATDVIGVAVDARPAAQGSRQRHFRVWFRINGTWQAGGDPAAGTGFVVAADGATGLANVMVGANTASANGGAVNFGQSGFAHAPPDDFIAPAHHRQTIMAEWRYRYSAPAAPSDSYAHAEAYGGRTLSRDAPAGIPTLISSAADARAECDRWAALYASDRFFYSFEALLPAGVAVDQIEPGDVISVTYPRFGLTAKLLRVVAVEGDVLGRSAKIKAWG